ncbi:hypothetical protein [Aureispira anguillae]|uniref:HTH cro/C1-type domain-containing protein n=1 Tax=Aureispira anguillae TaxID=2864201 RepID=A0A916DUS4_9BACT|nr:hypothetical protein [Aureispira anguillae]BDS12972.1 hypothetical protein AsAng_0037000 [Aureispira anguillae]
MKKKQLTKQQLFCQFLDELAVSVYRNLHERIGITKKMLTHIRNAPNNATYELTLKFAKALEMDAAELIDNYGLGASKITVEEYKELK